MSQLSCDAFKRLPESARIQESAWYNMHCLTATPQASPRVVEIRVPVLATVEVTKEITQTVTVTTTPQTAIPDDEDYIPHKNSWAEEYTSSYLWGFAGAVIGMVAQNFFSVFKEYCRFRAPIDREDAQAAAPAASALPRSQPQFYDIPPAPPLDLPQPLRHPFAGPGGLGSTRMGADPQTVLHTPPRPLGSERNQEHLSPAANGGAGAIGEHDPAAQKAVVQVVAAVITADDIRAAHRDLLIARAEGNGASEAHQVTEANAPAGGDLGTPAADPHIAGEGAAHNETNV